MRAEKKTAKIEKHQRQADGHNSWIGLGLRIIKVYGSFDCIGDGGHKFRVPGALFRVEG
jgi:hypothetical protein